MPIVTVRKGTRDNMTPHSSCWWVGRATDGLWQCNTCTQTPCAQSQPRPALVTVPVSWQSPAWAMWEVCSGWSQFWALGSGLALMWAGSTWMLGFPSTSDIHVAASPCCFCHWEFYRQVSQDASQNCPWCYHVFPASQVLSSSDSQCNDPRLIILILSLHCHVCHSSPHSALDPWLIVLDSRLRQGHDAPVSSKYSEVVIP